MILSDCERDEKIEALERQVAALKKIVTELIGKYNWHDHGYDYSSNSNSYDYDAKTQGPGSGDRVDEFLLEQAFK